MNILENRLKEELKENEKLFSKEELKVIYENYNLVKKIYLLAIKNVSEIM